MAAVAELVANPSALDIGSIMATSILDAGGGGPQCGELKSILHRRVMEQIPAQLFSTVPSEQTKGEIRTKLSEWIEQERTFLSTAEKSQIVEEVLMEAYGLGPLEPLLQDPTISDILVTTPHMVYIERDGRLHLTDVEFRDDNHLLRVIEKIAARVGRRIDQSSPMVDARLPDGSRVNAVISPVAVDGPVLSIRRFRRDVMGPEKLVQNFTLTEHMLQLLEACVRARLNILISGGTGAGKTTLLNVLSGFISDRERIVTIEDSAELQLRQKHVVRLEARPSNIDGAGAIPIRQLVINALRMRPDRIVVGEVRGEETLDMLQAMNTGHDGSLTTVHANNPRDAVSRLEVMVGMANANMGMNSVRRQISSAIDVIVQISRLSDGCRRITHLTECCGMEGEMVTTQEIFGFEKLGIGDKGRVQGRFRATGIRPKFYERFSAAGIQLPGSLFQTVMEIK